MVSLFILSKTVRVAVCSFFLHLGPFSVFYIQNIPACLQPATLHLEHGARSCTPALPHRTLFNGGDILLFCGPVRGYRPHVVTEYLQGD